MAQFASESHLYLTVKDLDILTEVWEAWCADKEIDGGSEAAQVAARSLIDWHRLGINDKHQLRSLLEPL